MRKLNINLGSYKFGVFQHDVVLSVNLPKDARGSLDQDKVNQCKQATEWAYAACQKATSGLVEELGHSHGSKKKMGAATETNIQVQLFKFQLRQMFGEAYCG